MFGGRDRALHEIAGLDDLVGESARQRFFRRIGRAGQNTS